MTTPIRISPEGIGLGQTSPAPKAGSAGFADELGKALQAVDQVQKEGDAQAAQLALGGGNLHETALALETADVAMRTAVKVRNKLVDAYQEVMRMNL